MPYSDPEMQATAQRKHYEDNKEKYMDRNAKRRKDRKVWFEKIIRNIVCKTCGERDHDCLDFHHMNPSIKHDTVMKMLNEFRSKERVVAEMEKCIVLCSNCHRKYHAGNEKMKLIETWFRESLYKAPIDWRDF